MRLGQCDGQRDRAIINGRAVCAQPLVGMIYDLLESASLHIGLHSTVHGRLQMLVSMHRYACVPTAIAVNYGVHEIASCYVDSSFLTRLLAYT